MIDINAKCLQMEQINVTRNVQEASIPCSLHIAFMVLWHPTKKITRWLVICFSSSTGAVMFSYISMEPHKVKWSWPYDGDTNGCS